MVKFLNNENALLDIKMSNANGARVQNITNKIKRDASIKKVKMKK